MVVHMDKAAMVEWTPTGLVLMLQQGTAGVAVVVEPLDFGMPVFRPVLAVTAELVEFLFTDNYHGISNHRF
jgi:hypothetical protein